MGKKIIKFIGIIKRALLEIIYQNPNKCVICHKEDVEGLCRDCLNKIKRCEDETELCIGYYKGPLRELILSFKGNGNFQCGELLVDLISLKIQNKYKEYILTYIPIGEETLKRRGFNQCEYIAKELSFRNNLRMLNTLSKIKKTKDQKTLNKEERKENLLGAFKVINDKYIRNKKFILIDDIITTGSTLSEGDKVLKEAGALEVKILTLAKSHI
ncbi:MAG: ComF family protein [Clostridiales bacterium]|nr:ComF family protein [Clostridiales bacterium]